MTRTFSIKDCKLAELEACPIIQDIRNILYDFTDSNMVFETRVNLVTIDELIRPIYEVMKIKYLGEAELMSKIASHPNRKPIISAVDRFIIFCRVQKWRAEIESEECVSIKIHSKDIFDFSFYHMPTRPGVRFVPTNR